MFKTLAILAVLCCADVALGARSPYGDYWMPVPPPPPSDLQYRFFQPGAAKSRIVDAIARSEVAKTSEKLFTDTNLSIAMNAIAVLALGAVTSGVAGAIMFVVGGLPKSLDIVKDIAKKGFEIFTQLTKKGR